MMINWSDAVVSRVVSCKGGVQQIEVILVKCGQEEAIDGLQCSQTEIATQTQQAVLYTELIPPVGPGDRVVLNTTAVKLGLGSGGAHFVHHVVKRYKGELSDGNDRRSDDKSESEVGRGGHIMKLRYTPQQRAVLAVEEATSPHHELFRGRLRLDGMPVLIGELHSMLPIAVAWMMAEHGSPRPSTNGMEDIANMRYPDDVAASTVIGEPTVRMFASESAHTIDDWQVSAPQAEPPSVKPLRIAYVMSDGGALPLAYSRHATELTACGWLSGTVTYGHAYGGSLEAVNKFTALLAARHVHRADITIATMGPGIVGTGTRLGHTATETAELVHAAHLLGGRPVLMPRISFADTRDRHRGLSNHTLTALSDLCLVSVTVPLPADLSQVSRQYIESQIAEYDLAHKHQFIYVEGIDYPSIVRRMEAYSLPITTMRRNYHDDPAFWAGVCAAAQYAVSPSCASIRPAVRRDPCNP